jgi:hypothetical protein
MSKDKPAHVVAQGSNKWTLLFVAITGGIVAVSLQPLIFAFYAYIGLSPASIFHHNPSEVIHSRTLPSTAMPLTTMMTSTVSFERQTTTSAVPLTTMTTTMMTTTVSFERETTTRTVPLTTSTTVVDLTVDEEPLTLRDEPLVIKLPPSTTVKPVTITTPKSTTSETKKRTKSVDESQTAPMKTVDQTPELIDVTGRNRDIPDEVKNFKSTRISMYCIFY